jgi:5,10-methenyltetrahydrofolate synthetase
VKVEDWAAQTEKAELRHRFREARREYSSAPAAKALTSHLRRWLRDFGDNAQQICAYRATAEEAPFALTPYTNYFYPRIEGDDLGFLRPLRGSDFVSGPFGIFEPVTGRALDPEKPLIVFCPAVAVDGRGGRLGMGKGYYDRFFSKHPHAARVGVTYQVQVAETPLPAEKWDQALDWIVTDKMILRTSQRSLQSWI